VGAAEPLGRPRVHCSAGAAQTRPTGTWRIGYYYTHIQCRRGDVTHPPRRSTLGLERLPDEDLTPVRCASDRSADHVRETSVQVRSCSLLAGGSWWGLCFRLASVVGSVTAGRTQS